MARTLKLSASHSDCYTSHHSILALMLLGEQLLRDAGVVREGVGRGTQVPRRGYSHLAPASHSGQLVIQNKGIKVALAAL